VPQHPSWVGMLKHCELVGRSCYRTESKISDESYIPFISGLVKRHHCSPLEHGTVYLTIPTSHPSHGKIRDFFSSNHYSHVVVDVDETLYITTNYRVYVENKLDTAPGWNLYDYWSEPTLHDRRYTFRIDCPIEVYKDLQRHRPVSPMIESTRYCAYSGEKFSHSVTFSTPKWVLPEHQDEWDRRVQTSEDNYFWALEQGYKPEEASYFLIQGTHALCFFTGFLCDWRHLLDLRYHECTGPVRPDVKECTTYIYNALRGITD